MARLFDITTTGDTATIQPGGVARLVFTVTNTTPRPLRGSLRPKALDAAQPGWLQVVGDAERDFAPGLAHQVEVTAKVPPGTAPAKFRVRLDALSVANPDDDFTEGPPVGVTVQAPKIDEHPTGIPWWVWVLIAVVVLALIGAVTWFAMRKKGSDLPIVPADIRGKPFDEAKQLLERQGLVVNRQTTDITDGCPGKVVATTPAPGSSAPAGSTVAVNVGNLPYGPATCKQGFVWRNAFNGDAVCVTPESRAQAQQDNAAQGERTEWVVATTKDFEDIQRERPQTRAVPKGDWTRIQPLARERLMIDAMRVPRVLRCKVPYTERRANAQDRVCVTQATQLSTDAENRQADSRMACPHP
jgi:hypothetical protein